MGFSKVKALIRQKKSWKMEVSTFSIDSAFLGQNGKVKKYLVLFLLFNIGIPRWKILRKSFFIKDK